MLFLLLAHILNVRNIYPKTTLKPNSLKKEGKTKSHRKELWFNIPARRAFINLTAQVQECLKGSEIREGLILVNTKHI